jgi:hypothetical protein
VIILTENLFSYSDRSGGDALNKSRFHIIMLSFLEVEFSLWNLRNFNTNSSVGEDRELLGEGAHSCSVPCRKALTFSYYHTQIIQKPDIHS